MRQVAWPVIKGERHVMPTVGPTRRPHDIGANRQGVRRQGRRGKGLQPHLEGAGWDRIRDLSYEGRGG